MKSYHETISEILNREVSNRHYIYLYPRHNGKAWVAYEQSARNLHQLVPHIKHFCRRLDGTSRFVTTLVIPQYSLDYLTEKGVDICDYDNGRNLRLTLPWKMRSYK